MEYTGLLDGHDYQYDLNWLVRVVRRHSRELAQIDKKIEDAVKLNLSDERIKAIVTDIISNASGIVNVRIPPNELTPATGDGSANDTAAIQGCIDYAAAQGGGIVYFPNGKYLTNSLSLKDNVGLLGQGRYSTVLVGAMGSNNYVIGGTASRVSIADLGINGNQSNQVNDIDGIQLTGDDYLLSNLEIKNVYSGVNVTLTDEHFQADNLVIDGCAHDGITVLGGQHIQIAESEVINVSSTTGQYGVEIAGDYAVLSDMIIDSVIPVGLVLNASNSVFNGFITGPTVPYNGTGNNNQIDLYGVEKRDIYDGNASINVGGNYDMTAGTLSLTGTNIRIDGDDANMTVKTLEVTANENYIERGYNNTTEYGNNKSETINGTYTANYGVAGIINSPEYTLNITNHLTYEEPKNLNELFNYVTMKSPTGQEYKVLVDGGKRYVEANSIQNTLYSAANKIELKSRQGFKRWTQAPNKKICFIGNSITEGSNNYPFNTYTEKFMRVLEKHTQCSYVNYALGGNNLYQFYSDSFTAVPGTAAGDQNHFWRPWAVSGQTWKQAALNYDADIYICSFGMNSNIGYASPYNVYTHVKSISQFLKQNGAQVIWIADTMSAVNKYTSTEGQRGVSRAMKIGAAETDCYFLNANRLSNILLYGQDTETFYVREYNTLPETGEFSLFGQMTVGISSFPVNEENAIELWFKYAYDGEQEGLLLRFFNDGTSDVVKAYTLQQGINTVLGQQTVTNNTATISLLGTQLNLNGLIISDIVDLQAGIINIPGNRTAFSSFNWISLNYYSFSSNFENTAVFPLTDTLYGGSSINHPSPLGHELFYFALLSQLLPDIIMAEGAREITMYLSPFAGGFGIPLPVSVNGTSPVGGYYYDLEGQHQLTGEHVQALQLGVVGNNMIYFYTNDAQTKQDLEGKTVQILFK